ncbi:hypothetical protein ACW14Y_12615 [Kitasatospora sp. cg17-2]
MADVRVSTGELDASANLAGTLAQEFESPVRTALTATTAASGRLTGWSIAGGLQQLGADWAAPLAAVRQRIADTSTKLRANAAAHANTEQAVAGTWSKPQEPK